MNQAQRANSGKRPNGPLPRQNSVPIQNAQHPRQGSLPRQNSTPLAQNQPGFQPGHTKQSSSVDLARQYERDIHQIEKYLFKERDNQGRRLERYVAHVRVIEDARSPNQRPPANSPANNKKFRFLILTVKISGRMRLHKARENPDGLIQIGRTWDFEELTLMEVDPEVPTGFMFTMGKKYYWETHSPKERRVWMTSVLDHYIRYTNGRTPQLVNCSVEYFHLEGLLNQVAPGKAAAISASASVSASASASASVSRSASQKSTPSAEQQRVQRQIKSSAPPLPNAQASSSPSPTVESRASPVHTQSDIIVATAAAAGHRKNRSFHLGHSRQSSNASGGSKRLSMLSGFRKSKREEEEAAIAAAAISAEQQRQQELRAAEREAERIRHAKEQAELERQRQELQREREELERQRQQEAAQREAARQALAAKMRKQEEEEAQQREQQQQQQLEPRQDSRVVSASLEKQLDDEAKRQLQVTESTLDRVPTVSSVQFSGHRTSREAMDEVTGDADDIGEDYDFLEDYADSQDNLDPTPDLHTAPLRLSSMQPPAPPRIEVGDDNSIDESEPAHQEVDTLGLPREIQNLVEPSGVSTPPAGQNQQNELVVPEENRPRARSRAFSRVDEEKKDNDFTDLFEEIGYDPLTDDYAGLEKKLMRALQRLQYDKINALAEVSEAGRSLNTSVTKAIGECTGIDKSLSLFGVQLSGFKDNVDYVEQQGHGLQVETTNKKLLKKELQDLLYSSDVPDAQLKELLQSKVGLSLENDELETILISLNSSLTKMRGSQSNDEDRLSNMKALQERRERLENVSQRFVQNFKEDLNEIFQSMSLSLSSKLQALQPGTYMTSFFRQVLIKRLSGLLTLSGMISYVKAVSKSDYEEILQIYTTAFKDFYDNLSSTLLGQFNRQIESQGHIQRFNFAAAPKDLLDASVVKRVSTSGNANAKKSSARILEELGLAKEESEDAQVVSATSTGTANGDASGDATVGLIRELLDSAMNTMAMQQELLTSLFSLSSGEQFPTTPIKQRVTDFMRRDDFIGGAVEPDREVSDATFRLMKVLFNDHSNAIFRSISEIAKQSMLEPPSILLLLEERADGMSATNQEYLYSVFTKMNSRIKTIWGRQAEEQMHLISKSEVGSEVTDFVKAFPVYFRRVEQRLRSSDTKDSQEITQRLSDIMEQFWMVINQSLNKGTSGKPDQNLTLLVNYKWLGDQMKDLGSVPLDLKTQVDELRSNEMSNFTTGVAQRHDIGQLIRVVNDMDGLVKSSTDPSKTNTYSRKNLTAMLGRFTGNNFKKGVKDLSDDVREQLLGRMCQEDSDRESPESLAVGKEVERDLFNNCMNSLAIQYTTTFNKLAAMLKQYYDGMQCPVDKIVVNYNFNKEYM